MCLPHYGAFDLVGLGCDVHVESLIIPNKNMAFTKIEQSYVGYQCRQ